MTTVIDRHGNVIAVAPDILEDWKQAAEVEAGIRREFQLENERLRAALQKYGRHAVFCQKMFEDRVSCDCGLDEARK